MGKVRFMLANEKKSFLIKALIFLMLIVFAFILTSCGGDAGHLPQVDKFGLKITFDNVSEDNLTLNYGYASVNPDVNERDVIKHEITVRNVSNKETELVFEIPPDAPFKSLLSSTCKAQMRLRISESCSYIFGFYPTSFGDLSLRINLTANEIKRSIAILTGKGLNNGQLQASASELNWGETSRGTERKIRIVRLSNDYARTPNQELKYVIIPPPFPFEVLKELSTCSDNSTLRYGASCELAIKIDPSTSTVGSARNADLVLKTATCPQLNIVDCKDNLTIKLKASIVDGNRASVLEYPTVLSEATIIGSGSSLYVLGGDRADAKPENWSYDTVKKIWTRWSDNISSTLPKLNKHKLLKFETSKILILPPYKIGGAIDSNTYIHNLANNSTSSVTAGAKLDRVGYAATLKNDNSTAYLFGGGKIIDDGVVDKYIYSDNKLFSFNSSTGWAEFASSAIQKADNLSNSAMVYSANDNSLYVYGGTIDNSTVESSKLWKYTFTDDNWTVVFNNAATLPKMSGHKMTIVGNKIYIYHNPPDSEPVLYFSTSPFTIWKKTQLTVNMPDFSFAMIDNGSVYAYGEESHNAKVENKLYLLVSDNFTAVALDTRLPITPFTDHSIVAIDKTTTSNASAKVFIYTGRADDNNKGIFAKYAYATKKYSECKTDIELTERSGATLTNIDSKVYLVGGSEGSYVFPQNIYEVTPTTCGAKSIQLGDKQLRKRSKHAAVGYKNAIYLFGGISDSDANTTVKIGELERIQFEPTTTINVNKLTTDTPPIARSDTAMAELGGVIYLYGGEGSDNKSLGDLWSYNIASGVWKKLSDNIGIKRKTHSLVSVNNKLYIIGGIDENEKEVGGIYNIDIATSGLVTAKPVTAVAGDTMNFKGRSTFINLDDNLFGVYDYSTVLYNF